MARRTKQSGGGSELIVVSKEAPGSVSVSQRTGTPNATSSTAGVGLLASPFAHEHLAGLYSLNTYHMRCILAKATMTAGLGYEIQGKTPDTQPSAEDKRTIDEFMARHAEKTGQAFSETMLNFATDFEIYGNAFLEGVRNMAGRLAEVYHIPGRECRLSTEFIGDTKNTRVVLQQTVMASSAKFKAFGTEPELGLNEYIMLKNYCPTSRYYGSPDYIPAIAAIALDRNAIEFNIRRFENNGVPDFVVTVSGGSLDKNASKMIRDYWEQNLKGVSNTGKTLILQSDEGDTEITITKLNGDIKEASFRLLRMDNRDEVIAAHGVPPKVVGVSSGGASLGQGSESREQLKVFRAVILNPRQTRLEFLLNERMLPAMGVKTARIVLNKIELSDSAADATYYKTLIDSSIITADEARSELGYAARTDEASKNAGALQGLVKMMYTIRKELDEKQGLAA